ncbi:MAG TPA: ribosome maturation factor RimP [Gaiellales bacterium]|jgi:ribosome maturation factor RimP|nr:ribosome maturation factor RimP [Gaiellales bacterium]
MSHLQHEIETTLAARVPGVEVVLADQPAPGRVRVFIDRPGGVDLDLCERVSRELSPLRERYALEVSSPGLDRPLAKPAHYQSAVGRRIAVRTDTPIDGRRRFDGALEAADDDGILIDQDGHTVRIAYSAIRRGNVVYDPAGGAS